MNKSEYYKGLELITVSSLNSSYNGFIFSIHVFNENPKNEKDYLFIEKTQISNLAIRIKYDDKSYYAEDIIRKTVARTKTRIDLGLFDKGNEYFQEITSENLGDIFIPIDDEIIQDYLLKGLQFHRKMYPNTYNFNTIDPYGFCEILRISKESYQYNADLLLEEGLIGTKNSVNGVDIGQIYITSHGIHYIIEKIKQAYLKKISANASINEPEKEKYDVAISFAGEDREIAEKIALNLKNQNIGVFYDGFEVAELWGKNLYDHLSNIYSEKAKYCIILVSKNYKEKYWTNLERESAQARAFRENREYILPVKLDETKIPGIHETIGYIDIKSHTIEDIANYLVIKLKKI